MKKLIAVSVTWCLAVLSLGCQVNSQPGSRFNDPLFSPAPGSPLNIGRRPNDIGVGDWNKDGKLDIVTCNEGDTVTVLLGNGRGGFAPVPGPPMNIAAHIVAAGDVNNDRNPDLAFTHHDSFGVVVLLGSGDGKFTPVPGSPFAAHRGTKAHNHGLTLNDLNSDGNLDITTSNQDENSVSVLLGNGRAGFTQASGSPFAVGPAPYPHAVGDVNKDGNPDIVTPNVRGNNVTVLLGDGRGGFRPAANSPFTIAARPYYIAIGDVNGDGNRDLMATHDDISLMTTLLGDGRGGFAAAPTPTFDLGRQAYKLVAADDARTDVVIGIETGDSIAVLLTNERGGYTHAAGSPYRAGPNPRIAIADLNGDGKSDIIAGYGSGDITVLLRK